jgi:hypothetical protein
MAKKKNSKKKRYLITPSCSLEGRGRVNLCAYVFLGFGFLDFPGGERAVYLSRDEYYRLRQNRDICLKEV